MTGHRKKAAQKIVSRVYLRAETRYEDDGLDLRPHLPLEKLVVGEQGIPQEIRAFIAEHIDSVMQLEVLLLLHKAPQTAFSAADLARELRIDPAWAQNQLIDLAARGLLVMQEPAGAEAGAEPKYRYQARTPEMHRAVGGLAQEYADRRVSVISFIFSKPVDKIRSFADAFRIRKDRSDG